MTTKDPEYYFKKITDIEESIKTISDVYNPDNRDNLILLNTHKNELTKMNTELIRILKEYEINDNSPKTNVQLYDEYKELYVTSYFTNIAVLLGICLLVRYIIYYINI